MLKPRRASCKQNGEEPFRCPKLSHVLIPFQIHSHNFSSNLPPERACEPFSRSPELLAHRNPDIPDWISNIELIHHYTVHAYRTIGSLCCHAFTALQNDVPSEAMSQPFLMHQILAFSALHLAYLRSDLRHRYLIQVSQHQDVAIKTINEMLKKSLEPDSCHALYASSLFVAVSGFGMLPSCDRFNDSFQPIESLTGIFRLMRGMHTILTSSDDAIRNGPLKTLLSGCSCESPQRPSILGELALRLGELLSFVENQTPTIDDEERRILVEAVAVFIQAIATVMGSSRMIPTLEMRVIFSWPMKLPALYLDFLRQEKPLALVILSYYCVLLQSREPNHWMFIGWSDALMKLITNRIRGSLREELIQWPIDVIGEQKAKSVLEDTKDASDCENLND
ncbi:uncharacterized protein FMAN_09475 [Fusarium mangiferae]|uniref:Uncharacterized protein n=1 Tax=Fusarium mangiferae TaxID=192010 RepID=A0A1L7T3Q3_FUSMA|nr:uncharacterized protein FMAN_09475 [Fusarium mangiferae]CVK91332.1 uncharacterized protein FMAN_09475 [Fusarium mangiferae]